MSRIVEQDAKQMLTNLLQQSQKLPGLQIEKLAVKGYEQVLKISEKKSGLSAIIAIHDTTLGPALGGIRIYPYATFNDALEDVLRLAKGMTYKAAISDVGFGGGKSVIIADPKKDKTPEMLMAFGAVVESLGGIYICAEDAGCTTEDVKIVRKATKYVVGLSHEKSSGNPAPFTGWGVFRGIQASVKKAYGTDSLEGKIVAVQGLGSVGSVLCEYLFWAGADLILADIDESKATKLARKYGARVVSTDQILKVDCDVFAPCALGAIINDQTIPQFRCKAIAGAANNQLHRDHHANALKEKGILYAPDFVINAGGLLNVSAELEETGYLPTWPREKATRIYDTLLAIFEIAEKNHESTQTAALALADYRIRYQIGKRVFPPIFHHGAEV